MTDDRDPDDGTGDPAADADVDPDALREDLDAIKSAMGLEERYPGQARMWLLYGAVVGATAVGTNLAFTLDLPNAAYVGGWFAMVVVIVLAQLRLVSRTSGSARPGVDWRQLFGAFALGLVVLWIAIGDVIASETEGAVRGAHYFSHVLVFLGIAFLLVGVLLGAERIALRDRLPFYAGGAWMLGLAAVVPHVRFLQLGGWAVFGVLFAVHAVTAYLFTGES